MRNKSLLVFTFITLFISTVSAQVGIGTASPKGALDVTSSNSGFVPPRVALTGAQDILTVLNPQGAALVTGTMVYNTATAGTDPYKVVPGYYYWNGTVWLKMTTQKLPVDEYNEDDLRVTLDRGSSSTGTELAAAPNSTAKIWYFKENATGEMYFTVQMPHNWVEGTTIYPHLHWTPKTSGTGDVKWNLDYQWADINYTTPDIFPATTTASTVTNGPFTLGQHRMTNIGSGIDGTGKHISSVLICRLWRNGSDPLDTYGGDAGGLSMDFHITISNPFSE